MREILFRGQWQRIGEKLGIDGTPVDGKWVYGGVFQGDGDFSIIYSYNSFKKFIVYAETVGQYTGLTDKNGVKIFEGDIIKTHYANANKADFVEQVVFHNGRFCALYRDSGHGKMWMGLADGTPHLPQDKSLYMEWCEIIGNIHDNPELLKGGSE